jgi:hypothetical protein
MPRVLQILRRPGSNRFVAVGFEVAWLFIMPPALMTGYLWLSSSLKWSPQTYYVALAFCILTGSLRIWVLPISASHRVIMFLPYAAVMIIFLFIWSLTFGCLLFGACL